MLFSGKENVFMCLVTFQNIFRKIFSGVWKRRRKRQNPEKPGQTQKNTARSRDGWSDLGSRSTSRSREASIAIGANSTSRDCDRRRDLTKRRSQSTRTVLREITSSDRDRQRDLAKHRSRWSRSRERCFARDCAAQSRVLSLSRSPFAWALFARPQFRKSFEVKIGTKMNFRGQRYYFTINWKWFLENSIFQTNQTAYFTENDFLKPFSPKTNTT